MSFVIKWQPRLGAVTEMVCWNQRGSLGGAMSLLSLLFVVEYDEDVEQICDSGGVGFE